MVGTTLNTRADNTKLIPRDPRSIVLDRAPVCLFKWKPVGMSCRIIHYMMNKAPTEVEVVQVAEDILSNPPDAVLGHTRKYRIPDGGRCD